MAALGLTWDQTLLLAPSESQKKVVSQKEGIAFIIEDVKKKLLMGYLYRLLYYTS